MSPKLPNEALVNLMTAIKTKSLTSQQTGPTSQRLSSMFIFIGKRGEYDSYHKSDAALSFSAVATYPSL